MTAFATSDDVQARSPVTLTDAQLTRAAALLDDAAAEILVYAPSLATTSALGKSVSCQAVLRALGTIPGVGTRTVGSVSTTYSGDIYLTPSEIESLQRAGTGDGTPAGAFSIKPFTPRHYCHHDDDGDGDDDPDGGTP